MLIRVVSIIGNQPGAGRGNALNPYGESVESRGEAEAMLKSAAGDARSRTYQAGVSGGKMV